MTERHHTLLSGCQARHRDRSPAPAPGALPRARAPQLRVVRDGGPESRLMGTQLEAGAAVRAALRGMLGRDPWVVSVMRRTLPRRRMVPGASGRTTPRAVEPVYVPAGARAALLAETGLLGLEEAVATEEEEAEAGAAEDEEEDEEAAEEEAAGPAENAGTDTRAGTGGPGGWGLL